MTDPQPNAENPEALADLEKRSPASKAGGAPSIYHAMRAIANQPGLMRGGEALLKLNQKGGFDCPSCAWPDPDGHRSTFEFCENGVKAVASEATKKRVDAAFFARYTISELSEQSDYWLDQHGRLAEPMILKEGSTRYEPIGWDDAFDDIANELRNLKNPNDAIFYTSGRASNEAAFVYQLFARAFGTNNLPDCSNMCHESSGMALSQSIGIGKGTVTLEDLREAELILIVGQNPGTNHPRMLTTLQQAKERGATIVSINPLREAGLVAFAHPQKPSQVMGAKTPLADWFIQVPINRDQALFQGVGKRLLEMAKSYPGVLDDAFIEDLTDGFDQYRSHLEALNWEAVTRLAGVSYETIDRLAQLFRKSERIISCWAMGLTQHQNAVGTIRDLANLHLLRGAIGRKGAGLCPVRGHSNVQGDRTMGICEYMPEWFHKKLEQGFGISSPRELGLDTVRAIRAMREEPGKVFFALGGNFLSATPDTEYTAKALRACRLTVHVSTKLNRSHLVTGKRALILPCLGRSERDLQESGLQWVSVENSMGIVHSSSGTLTPASDCLRSEVSIVCNLARRTLGGANSIDWGRFERNYDEIRSAIESVVPGFENYNSRGRRPGGFYLPNPAKERRFNTKTGKANFSVSHPVGAKPMSNRLILMTIRSHDQFNTTIYGMDDRYRGIHGERRIVLMNRSDMARIGLKAEEKVDVVSFFAGEQRWARLYLAIPYDIPRGCVAMYFPEANVLVPIDHVASGSFTPASKSVEVEIRKHRKK
ncbi:FdhF/YdeP family oxidoreductase [Pelagicoccus sp. SDUM812003]|uniref:FdhF/YdeP family oxidoreductase n=1 Tax=Pelagicoccus sp. SDUM812003 TaxID=3041267 RepID=UPI00280F1FD7|nr:FdhF/YdeP family oxidoreductase [Pelagicoccus sp. SDUM812003]MDQ8201914.1 FdhF/YdeP family oxidoreductase [Pelagicoccus sp. SDUM812003]